MRNETGLLDAFGLFLPARQPRPNSLTAAVVLREGHKDSPEGGTTQADVSSQEYFQEMLSSDSGR